MSTIDTQHSEDGTSCGVFVCKFAEAVLNGGSLEFQCTDADVAVMRQNIGLCVLQQTGLDYSRRRTQFHSSDGLQHRWRANKGININSVLYSQDGITARDELNSTALMRFSTDGGQTRVSTLTLYFVLTGLDDNGR
ncbi:hypothetical protein G5714_024742 [Onychostoma macrolepis]|uniref:Ubiquitin-like protease family profile domain-containing protein n=1 Tax=Onychostoma macrolepis TaxID=369639 RepID=A0A7J6BIG3_9TELE|nr:hypothetical protein G5714_024742 [Onychostoma macrolepis]